MNSYRNNPLVDYLNRNIQYSNPRTTFTLEEYFTKKSFEQIVNERIEYLYSLNKELVLLWSGGLDSTMIFYKLIYYKPTENYKFKIVMTEMSEVENYNLFQRIIKNDFNSISSFEIVNSTDLLKYLENNKNDNKIYISGDLGDQVFYSNLTYKYFYENMHIPYRIIVPKVVIEFTQDKVNKILKNPVNATIANWCWAIDFIYKWDCLDQFLKNTTGNTNIISFFNNIDFQNWSVTHQIENSKFTKFTDKSAVRNLISMYSNDDEWLCNKTKIGSQRMFFNPENYKIDYNRDLGVM